MVKRSDPEPEPVTATTCRTCNRALWSNHADKNGNCVGCAEAPHTPTEEEFADLGRPATEGDTD